MTYVGRCQEASRSVLERAFDTICSDLSNPRRSILILVASTLNLLYFDFLHFVYLSTHAASVSMAWLGFSIRCQLWVNVHFRVHVCS